MKVALVHDYLKEYGGAERVLEALHEIYPEAPIFTAYFDPKGLGSHAERFNPPAGGWEIRTSWLQKLPFANRLISPFRVFAPLMFQSFDFSGFDVVISSDATYFSKSINVPKTALHICYIHTPPRYLYGYTTSYNYKKHWWTRMAGELANHFLRLWDFQFAQKPDILVANSKNVAERIKKFYRRESLIIYPPVSLREALRAGPPVDTAVILNAVKNLKTKPRDPSQIAQDDKMQKDYFLSVGRLVRGKGIEVIVQACTKLGVPLKVTGSGPEMETLKKIAGATVEFLGGVSDEQLPSLYAGAKATIVASEDEDFGIVPVESMAAGTPVIAPRAGGFLETVIEDKTGLFFGGPGMVNVESLMEALKCFNDLNHWSSKTVAKDCQKQAEKFSKVRFKKEILELIEENIKK